MLIIYLVLNSVLETSLTLLPVYKEFEQVPYALLYKNISAAAESGAMKYSLLSVQWALCADSFTPGCYYWLIKLSESDGYKFLQMNATHLSIKSSQIFLSTYHAQMRLIKNITFANLPWLKLLMEHYVNHQIKKFHWIMSLLGMCCIVTLLNTLAWIHVQKHLGPMK